MAVYKKGKSWYIDYYVDGQRKRKAIGSSRKMAERALAKRKIQIAEQRYLDMIHKSKATFDHMDTREDSEVLSKSLRGLSVTS